MGKKGSEKVRETQKKREDKRELRSVHQKTKKHELPPKFYINQRKTHPTATKSNLLTYDIIPLKWYAYDIIPLKERLLVTNTE